MARLLVDADSIVYGAGLQVEQRRWYVIHDGQVITCPRKTKVAAMRWCEANYPNIKPLTRLNYEPLANPLQIVKNKLVSLKEAFPTHDMEVYLTADGDKTNFRHSIAQTKGYKANRAKLDKPHWYKEIREYMIDKWDAEIVAGIEADDAVIMRLFTTDDGVITRIDEDDIIACIDKDLFQCPATFVRYDQKDDKGNVVFVPFKIDNNQAVRNFYTQVMYGDEIDNIPGMRHWCKPRKWGVKGIEKLFKDCTLPLEYYNAILRGYKETLVNEEYSEKIFTDRFKEQCQLLWLWRYEGDTWDWEKLL